VTVRGWDSPVWRGIVPFTNVLLRTRCSTMTTSCYVLVFSDSANEALNSVDYRRACGERGFARTKWSNVLRNTRRLWLVGGCG